MEVLKETEEESESKINKVINYNSKPDFVKRLEERYCSNILNLLLYKNLREENIVSISVNIGMYDVHQTKKGNKEIIEKQNLTGFDNSLQEIKTYDRNIFKAETENQYYEISKIAVSVTLTGTWYREYADITEPSSISDFFQKLITPYTIEYQPLSNDKIEFVKSVIKDEFNFDESRGDCISVDTIMFNDDSEEDRNSCLKEMSLFVLLIILVIVIIAIILISIIASIVRKSVIKIHYAKKQELALKLGCLEISLKDVLKTTSQDLENIRKEKQEIDELLAKLKQNMNQVKTDDADSSDEPASSE